MNRRHALVTTVLLLSSVLSLPATPGQSAPAKRPDAPNLAPYVPTPQEVVDRMLALAKVTKQDVLIDLGCGDGRIPITAAKVYGARGIGVDIDPQRIAEANANAQRAGVAHLVTFKLENALTTDVSAATVVTTYLLSASNLKLRPMLTRALKPGTRIVAHNYGFGDWTAREDRDVHRQRQDPPHDLPVDRRRDRASVARGYAERLAGHRAGIAALDARHLVLGNLRLGVAAVALAVGVAAFGFGRLQAWWLLLPVAAFVALAVAHARLLQQRERARRAAAYVDGGLARLEHRWQGRGASGLAFLPAEHLYAEDLDIVGAGSLFELLSTARTTAGEATLAGWLLAPATPTAARERQAAARDLADRDQFREDLAVLGPEIRAGADSAALVRWARQPVATPPPWGPPLLAALAAASVAGIAQWLRAGEPSSWLVAVLALQGAVGLRLRSRVLASIRELEPRARDLALVAAALERVENEPFTAPRAGGASRRVGGDRRAGLARGAPAVAPRGAAHLAAQPVLRAGGLPASSGPRSWPGRSIGGGCGSAPPSPDGSRSSARSRRWHRSVASPPNVPITRSPSSWTVPRGLPPTAWRIHCSPPMSPSATTSSSVATARGCSLVSGSNMSGKSTWLRAIGVNVVLAQAGAPVCAVALPAHAPDAGRHAARPGLAAVWPFAFLRRDHQAAADRRIGPSSR